MSTEAPPTDPPKPTEEDIEGYCDLILLSSFFSEDSEDEGFNIHFDPKATSLVSEEHLPRPPVAYNPATPTVHTLHAIDSYQHAPTSTDVIALHIHVHSSIDVDENKDD